MDGLLLVDKPAGPTSHDVVARMRRALREKRIGHTGTLDPLATGLLPLVLGKATRFAQFLSAGDKSYDATIRLGFATDTADSQGVAIGEIYSGEWPTREIIDAALEPFRGTFMQQPPAFSAKKIDGRRSYAIARAARADARLKPRATREPDPPGPPDRGDPLNRFGPSDRPELPAGAVVRALPAPASVTTRRIEIVSVEQDIVTLSVDCSAGFYIRSLAYDLGQRLGIGAHLTALRRTRSGDFDVTQAVTLEAAERDPACITGSMVAMSRMLPGYPSVTLTDEGVRHVLHGRAVGPADWSHEDARLPPVPSPFSGPVRLLDPHGELIALGRPTTDSGLLHPFVVLV
jgi:tRNA pseudouridine55 synthase